MKTRSTFSMNRMKAPIVTIALFLVSSFGFLVNAQPSTVYDVISGSASHTTLKAAIDAASLDGALKGEGPFTVFAPTDAAFAALPAGTVETLLADPGGALTDILLYHVVGAKALSTDLSDGQMITTLEGKQVKVTLRNDSVFINNAVVTVADLEADNGVVHVINAVLIPPTVTVYDVISGSAVHTTLKAAIDAAGLDSTLKGEGPFTVFAPTDEAFAALPAGTVDALLADPSGALTDILLYHVVGAKALSTDLSDGQMITTAEGKQVKVTIRNDSVFINNAVVTVADIMADNGVVHVINAVLIPPTVTVYDVISGSAAHTTLKAAIDAAGLDGTLKGAGPFTVFAPTDDAFAALPAGTVEALLADPSGALTNILLYHVVGAKALSTDLSDGQMITTVEGSQVKITIRNDSVFVDSALVTVADLMADNGVVHVINAVLIPAEQPTGISNVKARSIEVYPNPAKDYVVLRMENMEKTTVKILSQEGKLIRSYKEVGHGSTLDLSGIGSGSYLLVAKGNGKQVVSKLVISR